MPAIPPNSKLQRTWLRPLLLGFAGAALCLCLQYSSALYAYLEQEDVHFQMDGPNTLVADVSALTDGIYYVSAGNIHAGCDLRTDGTLLDSTRSPFLGIRAQLMFGAFLTQGPNQKNKSLTIQCEEALPNLTRFNDLPVVARFPSGMVIQVWRTLVGTEMGPVFSLILIFMILADVILHKFRKEAGSGYYLFFATCALGYSLVFAGAHRFFVTGMAAQLISIFGRMALSLSFIALCGFYSKQRTALWSIHVLVFLLICGLAWARPERVEWASFAQLWVFTACTIFAAIDLLGHPSTGELMSLIVSAAVTWSLLQCAGITLHYFIGSAMVSSGFILTITSALAVIRFKERMALEHQAAKLASDLETRRAFSTVVAGVVHDIRSPAAAIRLLLPEVATLGEDQGKLLSGALQRIHEIAEGLLQFRRNSGGQIARSPVAELLERLMREKRIEYKGRTAIDLRLTIDPSSQALQARIDPTSFCRAISNLINNAVEAIEGPGLVQIRMSSPRSKIQIVVEDSGKGIPAELIPELMKEGGTFLKSTGNGLGLFSARRFFEEAGGTIQIRSKYGYGTEVILELPQDIA